MKTTTPLYELLRRFRDETGAELCSVTSFDFGTRVEVGRPTTLSADQLDWSSPIASDLAEGRIERPRTLTAATAGHTINAEFDSFEATDKARPRFATLVREVERLLSNPSE